MMHDPFENIKSLFHIDLNISEEYAWWLYEMEKTALVLFVIHILQVIQDPKQVLFSDGFIQSLSFVLIGISFYFLVWKKLAKFVYRDDEVEGFRSTIKLFR